MNKYKILPLVFFLLASYNASAIKCKPWKEHFDNYEPKNFPQTNNLLRKPGEIPLICGTKILVKGKLVDENCVPISDARISIWQKACDGKYPYTPMRNRCNNKLINTKSSSTFLGAGSTSTDNKGEFHFITTVPGTSGKEKPQINIKISHRYFEEFNTKLDILMTSSELPPVDFETPYVYEKDMLVNEFKIVIPIKDKLREF